MFVLLLSGAGGEEAIGPVGDDGATYEMSLFLGGSKCGAGSAALIGSEDGCGPAMLLVEMDLVGCGGCYAGTSALQMQGCLDRHRSLGGTR